MPLRQNENKDSPRRNLSIIEVASDEENGHSSRQSHSENIIEVPSDAESTHSDDGVEIVSVTPAPINDDIQITAHHRMVPPEVQYPGAPLEPVPVTEDASDDASENGSSRSTPARSEPALGIFRGRRSPYPPPLRNVRRRPNPLSRILGIERFALPPDYFDISHLEQQALFRMFHSFTDTDEVSSTIMARLEREDESAVDTKMENEKMFNRKTMLKKKELADENPPGYTSNINADHLLLCELCGVELGEGIPEDFVPDPAYDENLPHHAANCKVNAPWFCVRQCFDTDRALSKRVFAAKCGHVFCGRCIKNIGNRPPGRRSKKQIEEVSVNNPLISAPRKCPAKDCGIVFNNKSKCTFTELFL